MRADFAERKTGMAIVKKLTSRSMAEVNEAAAEGHLGAPKALRRRSRLTTAQSFMITRSSSKFTPSVLLRYPVSLVGAGLQQNFNGLLRQYFPKGMCMSKVTQAECDEVARELNMSLRKRLGFRSPHWEYHHGMTGRCTSRVNPRWGAGTVVELHMPHVVCVRIERVKH